MSLRLSGVALLAVVAGFAFSGVAEAQSTASCDAMRSNYQSGFNALVSQVRSKSPALLLQYASSLGSTHSSRVPSRKEAMRALNAVRPACVQALGQASCGKLIASATSFINRSTELNARFKAEKCDGSLAN